MTGEKRQVMTWNLGSVLELSLDVKINSSRSHTHVLQMQVVNHVSQVTDRNGSY